jgi:hypothetical protein
MENALLQYCTYVESIQEIHRAYTISLQKPEGKKATNNSGSLRIA